ncbi:hypothetical protein THAOC_12677 [Thalassiosira oceanica]|uniref:Uncharacterized protein n=1 Tax=Thalassiosira oceanica TaxID=159749 RepID=K0SM36_THAOC|nr:hypothetical protein THAOC_12677 [Thalassiosira oceanica]|eukprot:EJK66410.1 hypothetical protein THAOC_12677 [Thalassiosira oceanica]
MHSTAPGLDQGVTVLFGSRSCEAARAPNITGRRSQALAGLKYHNPTNWPGSTATGTAATAPGLDQGVTVLFGSRSCEAARAPNITGRRSQALAGLKYHNPTNWPGSTATGTAAIFVESQPTGAHDALGGNPGRKMASCMDVWPILEQKKQSAGGEAPQSSSRPPPASLHPAQASAGLSAGCSSDGNSESDTTLTDADLSYRRYRTVVYHNDARLSRLNEEN